MESLEALRAAHRELLAAYRDVSCALSCMRGTPLYEELRPSMEGLDEALRRLLMACEPFISPARSSAVEK